MQLNVTIPKDVKDIFLVSGFDQVLNPQPVSIRADFVSTQCNIMKKIR